MLAQLSRLNADMRFKFTPARCRLDRVPESAQPRR
jgi:hypothetical protein